MPNLYIIAGCNGAGKTTASLTVLPEALGCYEFVNADNIAKGLSPFNAEGVAIESARIMLTRIDELLNKGVDFAIETTLASRSYASLVKRAKVLGYEVHLIFFWLNSIELAKERVAQRVANGGHNIPLETIERRYKSGIRNLNLIFLNLVDSWFIYDNSQNASILIAKKEILEEAKIFEVTKFKIIQDGK